MSDEPGIRLTGPAATAILRIPCGSVAPLVVNGIHYVGCARDKGHDGPHSVEITWHTEDAS